MNPANRVFLGIASATLVSAATLWEGTRYYAYYDIVGVPTVCQGYTGGGIVFGRKYSSEECNTFLRKELIQHSAGMLECVNVPLTENQFNAFALFTYNVGVGAFCRSSLLKKLNAEDYMAACNGLLAWHYAGGKPVNGLKKRRAYEREMCLDGSTN